MEDAEEIVAGQQKVQDASGGIQGKEVPDNPDENEASMSEAPGYNIISEKNPDDEESFLNLDGQIKNRGRAQTVIAESL